MSRVEERRCITIDSKGHKIFGVLHQPITDRKVPAVLMCHGFAGTKVGRYRMYVRLSEALAAVGIASLRLDFRGCGDSEGDFVNSTLRDQVDDALLGLKYLEGLPGIDVSRIGLLGRSLGGPVAVLAAREAGHIKSLVLWAAVYHGDPWLKTWEETSKSSKGPTGKPAPFLFQGSMTNPELFMQLIKLNMAQELDKLSELPFMCVHSDKDEVVAYSHADRYRQVRERSTARSDFIRLQRSTHDFSDHQEQEMTLKETTEWYVETLGLHTPLGS